MKILAIEKEIVGTTSRDFQPHIKAEAQKVWKSQQQNIIREIYFRIEIYLEFGHLELGICSLLRKENLYD